MKDTLYNRSTHTLNLFLLFVLSLPAFTSAANCTEDFETHRNSTYNNVDGVFTQHAADPDLSISIPDTKYCAGNTFTATYASGGTYNSGNIFIIQLSNPSGSFSSSTTNIGMLTSTANSGQITCTLPLSPTAGKLYRVRIVATNPSVISADNGTDITVGYVKKPDFYADKYKIQVGETTILRRSSSETANCSWILGIDSVPELPFSCLTQPVSYTTPGQRLAYLIALDENGCSATSYAQYIQVYSCNPTVPADAYVVTGTVTDHISNYGTVWVKPGGSYTSKSSNQIVYVSSGGSYTMTSGTSIKLAYLEAFSSFDGGGSSLNADIVYDPNAGMININNAILIPCSSLSLSEEDIPTAVDNAAPATIDVALFPNPTTGNFTIKSSTAAVYDVTVVNGLGQTETYTGKEIDTQMKGLLVVKINTDKGVVVKRICVIE